MNSKQLANTVCVAITGRALGDVPLHVGQELLDALNLTLAEWLQMLPKERRMTDYGTGLRGPVAQAVQIVQGSKGFAYVAGGGAYPAGGYASEEEAIGATVILDGISSRNQLQAPVTLQFPHLGTTKANASMTIYGDAVHLPASAWAVDGDVSLVTAGGEPSGRLTYHPGRVMQRNEGGIVGQPREWWMESIAPLQEEDSRRFVLRVWPLPDIAYAVRVPVTLFPAAFTMEDLFEVRSLPFNSMEQSLFAMLAKGAFVSSSARAESVDGNAVTNAATRAAGQLDKLQRPIHSQPGLLGTPLGF
jgi:hypothetical protein